MEESKDDLRQLTREMASTEKTVNDAHERNHMKMDMKEKTVTEKRRVTKETTEESKNREGKRLSSMHDASFSGDELMTMMTTTKEKKRKERTSERTMGRVMEHIAHRHMQPCQNQGSSYFLSKDKQYLCSLVEQTMKRPDFTCRHRTKREREVRKKRFSTQIGVHGITEAPCYTVTVIYGIKNDVIITAFPTK